MTGWLWLRLLSGAIAAAFASGAMAWLAVAAAEKRHRGPGCDPCAYLSDGPCECPRGEPCRSPSCPRRSDREVMR